MWNLSFNQDLPIIQKDALTMLSREYLNACFPLFTLLLHNIAGCMGVLFLFFVLFCMFSVLPNATSVAGKCQQQAGLRSSCLPVKYGAEWGS